MRVSRTAVTLQTSTLPDGVAHADITLGQHGVVLALGVVVVLALPGNKVERLALVVCTLHGILHVIGDFAFPRDILVRVGIGVG